MIAINLTTFLDIATASGVAKVTALRRFKRRGPYNHAHDFWLPLRRAIVKAHRSRDLGVLDRLMPTIRDAKKLGNYPERIQAHKKWCGRTEYAWFEPPKAVWKHGDVSVRVKPELGLKGDCKHTSVKLYFKAEPLSKRRVDVILHLLETTVTPAEEGGRVGILDVPRGRLIEPTVKKPDIEAALRGEAGYIMAAWDEV